MSYPLFPIEIEAAQGKIEFNDFTPGEILTTPAGYQGDDNSAQSSRRRDRIPCRVRRPRHGYITDTELNADEIDPALLELARDASIVVIDTTYTDEELPEHVGWGHSSWQQAVRLANEAGVGKLYLFHHDPEHDDDEMDRIAAAAGEGAARDRGRDGRVVY